MPESMRWTFGGVSHIIKIMENNLSLHKLYQSGMVLQRNCSNCISGKAGSAEVVKVAFRGMEYSAKADENGDWELCFNPGNAGGPDTLVVTAGSNEKITLTDVYTGELWLCSGQSNMQLQMNRLRFSFPEEFKLEENPQVRVFTVPVRGSFVQQDNLDGGQWLSARPENLWDMSGSSYFFAKKLHALTGVPVGVVNASQGGSPISAWMSEECFPADSEYRKMLEKCKDSSFVEKSKAEIAEKIRQWYEDVDAKDKGTIENWASLSVPADSTILAGCATSPLYDGNGRTDVTPECAANTSCDGNDATGVGVVAANETEAAADAGFSPSNMCDIFSDSSEWKPFNIPGKLGKSGDAGVFWFNKDIELTEEEAAILNREKAWLWLGRITDADVAFVNGQKIGGVPYMYPPRRYEIPAGVLHAGKNTLSVRVTLCGTSGPLLFEEEKPYMLFSANVLTESWKKALYSAVCVSPAERKAASAEGYVCIDLSGVWMYRVGCTAKRRPDEIFYEWGPTALYNGMLAPLFKMSFRGTVWYQGESNAGNPEEYKWLLKNMIELWRSKFTNSPALKDGNRLAFVVAELPLCGIRAAAPDYEADAERCRKWLETADDYVFSGREDCWSAFRRMQTELTRKIPDIALASFYGAGEWNDLHPEDKKTAGYKMAEAAFKFIE